jgi:glycosyltransferase involved in cell wall biosynthesis
LWRSIDRESRDLVFLTLATPMLNEEANVGPLLDEALVELARLTDRFEIIVVDDGSTDHTADVVRDYATRHREIRLVMHPQNLGYGHALRSGLAHSRGDLVALVDGDRQFRIADVGKLLAELEGNDVVLGYRIKRADPWHRLVIARVYHRVLESVFHLGLRDVDCGMKLYSRPVIDKILPELESRSAFISPELATRAKRAGFRLTEVGIPHHPRVAGKPGGATPRVIARTIGEIFRLRRNLAPERHRDTRV